MTFEEFMRAMLAGETVVEGDLPKRSTLTENEQWLMGQFRDYARGRCSLESAKRRERANDLWVDMLEHRHDRWDGRVKPEFEANVTKLCGPPNAKLDEVRALTFGCDWNGATVRT